MVKIKWVAEDYDFLSPTVNQQVSMRAAFAAPTPVLDEIDESEISGFTYVLTEDGDVYSWGRGANGANGRGDTLDLSVAKLVKGLPRRRIKKVYKHGFSAIANNDAKPGGYAIDLDGKVYSWGSGSYGSNANGNSAFPSQENNLTAKQIKGTINEPIKALYPFYWGCLALAESGKVYSWGSKVQNLLGDSRLVSGQFRSFADVVRLHDYTELKDVSKVIVSNFGALALTENGVVAWGGGTTGSASSLPRKVEVDEGEKPPVDILAIHDNKNGLPVFFYKDEDGYLMSSSETSYTGLPTPPGNHLAVKLNLPAPIKQLADKRDRALSSVGTVSLLTNGDVYCWGNYYNGNGATADSILPVKVQGIPEKAVAIYGGQTQKVLTESGDLYSWGPSFVGTDGTAKTSAVKVASNVKKSFAIKDPGGIYVGSDDKAYSWGPGLSGANGNNSVVDSFTPVEVRGVSNCKEIYHGKIVPVRGYTRVALDESYKLHAWGFSGYGSTGNGGPVDSTGTDNLIAQPVVFFLAPTLKSKELPEAVTDEDYSFKLDFTSDGETVFTTEGLPEGFSIDNSGTISGRASVSGSFTVKVSVTNGEDSDDMTYELVVNDPPLPPLGEAEDETALLLGLI